MKVSNVYPADVASVKGIIQPPVIWNKHITFRGKTLSYNRIPYNNRAERAVEVPIAFDFLAHQPDKESILEVGNVLQYYENALTEALRIRNRHIIDKFEIGHGIKNIDIMEMDSLAKYQTIVSLSTMEHIGQNYAPTGQFGEQKKARDLEAPLKAIAKIYDLLALGGQALLTVPFGTLIDGGWYIQFSAEYLDLLMSKYGLPQQAMTTTCLKCVAVEPKRSNPHQLWAETAPEELQDVRYDAIRGGARAVAIIVLTKLATPFSLDLLGATTSLTYESSLLAKSLSFTLGLFTKWFYMFSRLLSE